MSLLEHVSQIPQVKIEYRLRHWQRNQTFRQTDPVLFEIINYTKRLDTRIGLYELVRNEAGRVAFKFDDH